jgi:formate dehydrogenase gamma subunit
MAPQSKTGTVQRFTPIARVEHAAVIVLFVALVLTGMPQKWPDLSFSRWLLDLFGGVVAARAVHRVTGVVFSLLTVLHVARMSFLVLLKRVEPSMFFTFQDFRNAYDNLRYYLGRADSPPDFDHYDYRQKFEYWGMIFGSLVMVVTGLVLYFPVFFARFLPAELIPVSKVAHSNEALLAMAIIIVWHLYGAHLSPEVFPCDTSIFTGRISLQRLEEEHRLEYDRLFGAEEDASEPGSRSREPEPPEPPEASSPEPGTASPRD